jgi:alginate O-acetyltransferase complex protein AlgI
VNFTSHTFFAFLPLALLGYHLLRRRGAKYGFLLLASWVFYMSWNPWYVWVIVFPTVVDYAAGLLIESAPTTARRKFWLWASLAANLGLLAGFKYTRFVVDNACAAAGWVGPDWVNRIALPLGISFHTFQGISYTLDVYRRKLPAVRSFVDFALFVAFFPQLVAGPIVRAVEFLPQMVTPPRVNAAQVVEGLHWFVLGLFKKVFIADRLAQFVDAVFADPAAFDAATHRWAILAYAAQIYCDFSGYSDMAIGCAKWFGFELPQNFNFPYVARSLAEFWRRWHVTLSTWMRDYLYISLGGSRSGEARTCRNLVITMTLCGLWHGASWNYVLWGFYNGVLLSAHRAYDRLLTGRPWADDVRASPAYQLTAWAATMVQVFFGYVLVRSESWAGCWLVQSSLLGGSWLGTASVPVWVPPLVGLVALGHLLSGLADVRCRLLLSPAVVRAGAYVAATALVVVFGPGVGKAFIYFQF